MKRMAFVIGVLAMTASRADADSDPTALEASGSKHFELAEYAAAIADFKEAFRISDRPELLFNIAQAYRLAGDCLQARTFYKTYLRRVPDAANAAAVTARIAELDDCANKAAATQPAPLPPPTEPAATQPSPAVSPPIDHPGRTWKTKAGLAALGGGALGVGLGVVFAAKGSSKADDLREACATNCSGATARDLDDAGKAANRNAAIGLVAGGALIATGVVLVILDKPARETGPSVSVGATGAHVAWTWRF